MSNVATSIRVIADASISLARETSPQGIDLDRNFLLLESLGFVVFSAGWAQLGGSTILETSGGLAASVIPIIVGPRLLIFALAARTGPDLLARARGSRALRLIRRRPATAPDASPAPISPP